MPLALAGGGSFLTLRSTLHTTTNIDTIGRFLPVRFDIAPSGDCTWVVSA